MTVRRAKASFRRGHASSLLTQPSRVSPCTFSSLTPAKMFALAAPARNVACMAVGARHKGAKKHATLRPMKRTRADKNHGPAKYEPLPSPPPEFTVVSKAEAK
ncbi:hypothetical protein TSOC_002834 [Tetrabaena socialis]|uniref:Uncharacterized protein n=1 Tax=Tetrabaena socialis TaxID=47790 RepID=A0A2J8AD44_9CHLO|nr:hypothetical protein TSOC_002834 [Tetrabaena socialis]|eukprot:PNH10441.1 hypothetical protein TSOC_002834 [Tetrabaena socialis]